VLAPVDSPDELAAIDNARLDMQTAVRWFRAHATSLGIDPDRIGVGGSSAGAVTALGVAVNRDDPGIGDLPDYSSSVCTAVSISGANDPLAVDAGDAGAIFHHGTLDTVVPYGNAVETRDAMVAVGLPVQWNEYPGESHSFSSATQDLIRTRTIQWLYDHVATAPFPCSAAVAQRPRVAPQRQTAFHGDANKSAVISLVAVDAAAPGYVQLLQCGTTPGSSSNLNIDAPGQTRAVIAAGRFDGAGNLCLFNQPRTHLVADLQGYFMDGALDDIIDERILDTRLTSQPEGGSQTQLTGRPNSTAIASLVITGTTGPGYVQVLPCGAEPGESSNLNADGSGQTRAGLAFVRFDAAGHACVYTQKAADLVVDVQGYMSSASFDDGDDVRLLDTRAGPKPVAGTMSVFTGRPDTTAVVSITATETEAAGYVQALACDAPPGASSNLNADRSGQTIATLAFVRFDAHGHACIFNQQPTHLVVDLQGYLNAGAFDDVPDQRLLDTRA
jgi:predicted esterase